MSATATPLTTPDVGATRGAVSDVVADACGRCEFQVIARSVTAWASEHVPLSPKTPTAVALKAGLRHALAGLRADSDEILEAVFAGSKPSQSSDIENLLLYNIDTGGGIVRGATGLGLRMEADRSLPAASSLGSVYKHRFSHRIVGADAEWSHWCRGRELACWSPVLLGSFAGEKKLEQVWLALHRALIAPSGPPREADEPFAVIATVHPPPGQVASPAALVKGVLDGIVCAFQAHADLTTLTDVSARIARTLSIDRAEVRALLTTEERAVLGTVSRLVHVRSDGVQWKPSDNELVVADVRLGDPIGNEWALSGAITCAAVRQA